MAYKSYADSTLNSMSKTELIEIIRAAEHNYSTVNDMNKNQFNIIHKLIKQNNELKELLMLAVNDFDNIDKHTCICGNYKDDCTVCPYTHIKEDLCEWSHKKTAMKLIKEEII